MVAYACLITEANLGVIASEHPKFDREEALQWIKEHETGYFIRDEESRAFDCKYMDEEVFKEIYKFEYGDYGDLFRRILKL